MKLLLDTHALLWFLAGDTQKFSVDALGQITDRSNQVLASTVSFWEIAIKSRLGKIKADPSRVASQAVQVGFKTLTLQVAHVAAVMPLSSLGKHKDPFDHMLIAQALAEQATLVSQDAWMAHYPVPLLLCK